MPNKAAIPEGRSIYGMPLGVHQVTVDRKGLVVTVQIDNENPLVVDF